MTELANPPTTQSREIDSLRSQLREAQEALQVAVAAERDWRNRYDAVSRASGHLLYDWNPKTNEIFFAGEVKKVFGYMPAELAGAFAQWLERIHPDDRNSFRQNSKRLLKEKKLSEQEYRVRHRDGDYLNVQDNSYPIANNEGKILRVVGFLANVTERQRATQRRQLQYEVTRVLAESTTLKEAAGKLLQAICKTMPDWKVGGLWRLNPETDELYCVEMWRCTPEQFSQFEAISRQYCFPSGVGLPGRIIASGKAAWILDVTADKNFPRGPIAFKEGLHAAFGFPIRIQKEIVGVIEFFSSAIREPDDDLLESMTAIGSQIGQFIERKDAEEKIRQLNAELEERVRDRTADLELANKELEAFCYSVSHDLRAPLRSITGFSEAVVQDYSDKLDERAREYLQLACNSAYRMAQLIDDLLHLSRVGRAQLHREKVDLTRLAQQIFDALITGDPKRKAEFKVAPDLTANCDGRLLRIALENLLNNAWKFTGKKEEALIEFGQTRQNGEPVFFIRDNGDGFDMAHVDKLFGVFQRLHSAKDFPGTGIGLAIVHRIIQRHGGRVWAEGKPKEGASFYFTLPD